MENAKSNEQPHATGAAGKSAEMCSADAGWDGVPISSSKGSEKVQDAWGKGSGAPNGNRNAWKHGARSAETEAATQLVKQFAKLTAHLEAD